MSASRTYTVILEPAEEGGFIEPSRVATVPVHSNKALKRGTLHGIVKQAGLTVNEFIALL